MAALWLALALHSCWTSETICKHVFIKTMLIIHHDLPCPSSRGSHVKTDYAHTIIQHTPSSQYTGHLRLDISSCGPSTVYNTPLQVRSNQSAGETGTKQKWPRETSIIYVCTKALHSFLSFAHCRAASTVIPLPPVATFTPSV